MSPTQEELEVFASIEWAKPLLGSPNLSVHRRTRGTLPGQIPDTYCSTTVGCNDGMQVWLELYEKPAPGSKFVSKTISLCKFGPGFTGFPTICHGGAILTMLDEALAFAMIANEAEAAGKSTGDWAGLGGIEMTGNGTASLDSLKGYLVTAHLDVKFMKPVFCPGIVGIEVTMLQNKGHKMNIRGVMKDVKGTPLVQADGLWVRLGGGSKL